MLFLVGSALGSLAVLLIVRPTPSTLQFEQQPVNTWHLRAVHAAAGQAVGQTNAILPECVEFESRRTQVDAPKGAWTTY